MAGVFQADPDRIEVTPLSSWIAADVEGVDLAAPMSDAVFDRIYRAWLDQQVLRFRNQTLTDSQMIAFSRRGSASSTWRRSPAMARRSSRGSPRCSWSRTWWRAGRRSARSATASACGTRTCRTPRFRRRRAACTPWRYPRGRATPASSTCTTPTGRCRRRFGRRWRDAPSSTTPSTRWTGTTATAARRSPRRRQTGRWMSRRCRARSTPSCAHTRRRAGRPSTWAGARNTFVNGLPLERSEALLDALWAHAEELGTRTWHQQWQVGDLVIWDNRCAMHRRDAFSPEVRRVMHRTQVKAEAAPA